MKSFVLLKNIYFVWRNNPMKKVVHATQTFTKVEARLCSIAPLDFLPSTSKTNRSQQIQNKLFYDRLKMATQEKLKHCSYFNFTFTILENHSCEQQCIEYDLKLEICESFTRKDWLKVLRNICGQENGVKVKLALKMGERFGIGASAELVTKGMLIQDYDTNVQKDGKSESNICFCLDSVTNRDEVLKLLNLGECPVGKFKIILEIDDDAIVFADRIISLKEINLKILEETLTDTVIVTGENQVEIKCHQNFLSVRSPVFKAMLQAPMREGLTKRIEIYDASEQCIRLLLYYMYTSEIRTEDPELLVELLKLAHKYDVLDLERLVKIKLNEKPIYPAQVAINLLCFARNFDDDGSRKLKEKAVEVLKRQHEFTDWVLCS